MVSNRTVNIKGSKIITIRITGNEKTYFTVVLACLANGTKLKPMMIFKRKTMMKIPRGVLVHVQEKGQMDRFGTDLWLQQIWDKRLGNFNSRSLLVWNVFRNH